MNNMLQIFGHSPSWISLITTDVVQYLAARWATKLHWNPEFITQARAQRYRAVLRGYGALGGVWGFLDGTLYHIRRPEKDQMENYSGHHKRHGLLFQGLLTPDGLMISLMGPAGGRHTDVFLLHEFKLLERLREVSYTPRPQLSTPLLTTLWLWRGVSNADMGYIYTDKGYRPDYGLLTSYQKPPGGHLQDWQQRFNSRMSRMRQDVENGFGVARNLWKVAYSLTQNSAGELLSTTLI